MNEQTQDHSAGPTSQAGRWFFFLMGTFAASLEVFLRRRFGERYLGVRAAAAVLLIPFFGVFFGGHDLRPLLWFWGIYILMCFIARVNVLRRRLRYEHLPTMYTGLPHLQRWLPRLSEVTIKRFIEPVLIFVLGTLVCLWNDPLGMYLILGAICLAVTVNLAEMQARARALDLFDTVMAQRQIAERYRSMYRDRFRS
jgi:hypothetical protein